MEVQQRFTKVKEEWSTTQSHVFVLSFIFIYVFLLCPRQQVPLTEVVHVIFYLHEASSTCVGMCACNRTHQMDKIAKHQSLQ